MIDLHQDAWGKYVASPPGVTCPSGAKPGIGWDGAPQWATITDGADTCAPAGVRELAPAVMHAFDHFYADTDGIQTELVKTWAAVAKAVRRRPGGGRLRPVQRAQLGHRRGHARAPSWAPSTSGPSPPSARPSRPPAAPPTSCSSSRWWCSPRPARCRRPRRSPTRTWCSPRTTTTARSIRGTVEQGFAEDAGRGPVLRDHHVDRRVRLVRHRRRGHRRRDRLRRRPGHGHGRAAPGGSGARRAATRTRWASATGQPASQIIEFNVNGCPGDKNLGPVPQWSPILSRAYPRSAPGRLTSLRSDGVAGTMSLSGDATDAVRRRPPGGVGARHRRQAEARVARASNSVTWATVAGRVAGVGRGVPRRLHTGRRAPERRRWWRTAAPSTTTATPPRPDCSALRSASFPAGAFGTRLTSAERLRSAPPRPRPMAAYARSTRPGGVTGRRRGLKPLGHLRVACGFESRPGHGAPLSGRGGRSIAIGSTGEPRRGRHGLGGPGGSFLC